MSGSRNQRSTRTDAQALQAARTLAGGAAGIMLSLLLELRSVRPDLIDLIDRDEAFGNDLIDLVADECTTSFDPAVSHDVAWSRLRERAISLGDARLAKGAPCA